MYFNTMFYSNFDTFCASVCVILLSTTQVLGKYEFIPDINGWIRLHKVTENWEDAFQKCQDEGAILMSPNQLEFFSSLMFSFEDDTSYFIGTKAIFNTSIFASVEGVLLDDMPVTHMYSQLNLQDGGCLSMNHDKIRVVSCALRLPYICYKEKKEDMVLTECGTFDKGYKYYKSTRSCYKFFEVEKNWADAYTTCTAEGAYLAIVNDYNEKEELLKLIAHNRSQYVSVGLRCWEKEGSWRSVKGHSLGQIYNKWEGSTSPEKLPCVVAALHPDSGLLSSRQEIVTRYFICEKDPKRITFP